MPATVLCRLFASMGYRLNFLRAAAKRPVAAATSADAAPRGVVSPVVGSLEEREGLVLFVVCQQVVYIRRVTNREGSRMLWIV